MMYMRRSLPNSNPPHSLRTAYLVLFTQGAHIRPATSFLDHLNRDRLDRIKALKHFAKYWVAMSDPVVNDITVS